MSAVDPQIVNLGIGPPPLQTPITAHGPDEFGVPFQHRGAPGSGNLNPDWSIWLSRVGACVSPAWRPRYDAAGTLLIAETPFPALQGGWTVLNPTLYGPLQYCSDGFRVYLRGQIQPGASTADGTLLFTMPIGFRPVFSRVVIIPKAAGGTTAAGALVIAADGTVKLSGAAGCTSIWLDTSFFLT